MVVVPMIAMFSHRVPAPVRTAIRDAIWSRLVSAAPPAQLHGSAAPADLPAGTTAPPAAPAGPAPAAAPPTNAVPSPVAAVAAASAPAAAAVTVPVDAACQDAETRLAALGAMAIECHPMPGGVGHHAASCRVAVDATGQLHRLFQASGSGRADAMRGLLADVSAWRQRLALRAGDSQRTPPGVPPQTRTMNF
jgi:hypothetical protein